MLKVGDIITLKNKEVSAAEHIIVAVSINKKSVFILLTIEATKGFTWSEILYDEIESYVPRGESDSRLFNIFADGIKYDGISFDDLIDNVDGKSLQRIFREIDDRTLAGVIFACKTKERVSKIKENVSKNHFARLLETIECSIGNTEYEVKAFVKTVRQLDEMGEIVISRDNETFVDIYNTPVVEVCSDGSVHETTKLKSTFDINKWFAEQKQIRKERDSKFAKDLSDWKHSVGL